MQGTPLELLLALGRTGAFVFLVPALGGPRVPTPVKLGIGLALAIIGVGRTALPGAGLDVFVPLMVKEIAVGLTLGWSITLAFHAVQAAGHLIEVSYGFGASALLDPFHATESTAVGQFFSTVAMLLFLAVDGHHLLVRLIARSFDVLPIADVVPADGLAQGAIGLFRVAFFWGIGLAAPLLVASMLVEVGLGLVARAMPQMNVFIVSLPLKVGLGIVLIGALVNVELSSIGAVFTDAVRQSILLLERIAR